MVWQGRHSLQITLCGVRVGFLPKPMEGNKAYILGFYSWLKVINVQQCYCISVIFTVLYSNHLISTAKSTDVPVQISGVGRAAVLEVRMKSAGFQAHH